MLCHACLCTAPSCSFIRTHCRPPCKRGHGESEHIFSHDAHIFLRALPCLYSGLDSWQHAQIQQLLFCS